MHLVNDDNDDDDDDDDSIAEIDSFVLWLRKILI